MVGVRGDRDGVVERGGAFGLHFLFSRLRLAEARQM